MIAYRFLEGGIPATVVSDLGALLAQASVGWSTVAMKDVLSVNHHSRLLLAVDEGLAHDRIVGMAVLAPVRFLTGNCAMVGDLIVHRKYEGRDIDLGLVERIVAAARKDKKTWVFAVPAKADRLFARAGFTAFGDAVRLAL